MALGALIGAYQEDDSGGLRALYPLAGRTLLEYQVRCAAAAGAMPVVVLVERLPAALNEALERLRHEGIPVIAVSDSQEAASRFEAGMPIVMIADGLAPDFAALAGLAEHAEPTVLLVPDDDAHARFERVDAVEPLGRPGAGRCADPGLDRRHARRLGPPVDPASPHSPGRRPADRRRRRRGRRPARRPAGGSGRLRAASAGRHPRRPAATGRAAMRFRWSRNSPPSG